ncbi:glycosyl hydrolase family 28-related protein [Sinorhizobium meliloti]|uniref:glycosyl hydrolase family 28-related protein n=1 Tax=Rhizobium meliloti TaxID=382 RepID=UPI001F41A050|nr:glycosyl hydrolase family 28-related protein [Sinorhizobium meliloti]
MSITSPDARVSTYNPVVPTTEFPAGFPLFDNDDLIVIHNGIERDDFAVSAIYVEGVSTDAKAVFAVGITGTVQVVGSRQPHRTNKFGNGPLPSRDFNLALDTVESEVQELHRDVGRAVKVDVGADPVSITVGTGGQIPVFDDSGDLIPGSPNGAGNMMREVYDPSSIGGDAFNTAKHKLLTAVQIETTVIPAVSLAVMTYGYAVAGDGGQALYRRISAPGVVKPWHRQSADGAWWQIAQATINPYMLGTAGDGVADDYPEFQNFLDALPALSARGHVPKGTFRFASGSPKVSSNTTLTGDGKGVSILVQPNYYSYVRPGPYVKENVVDWNALWMDVGTAEVEISGLELRGPFWQPDEAGYTANPVQNWPANNGIHVRGADYQYRKNLPYTGESFNIRIHDCHLEGWAEDAIQTDMVTHVWVERNTMTRCGRGGHRGYSCVHAWTQFNSISNLSPGDYLNNGNRMYGVEFTRHYAAGVRASADFWVVGNRVFNCLQWKGMGTHGGRRGNFLFNDVIDCHHGIGIDKGGFTVEDGIAPPGQMRVIGNRFLRTAAGDPTEGNGEGGAGHALFIVAHDTTDTHLGRDIVIADNICEGWGSENLEGGVWIGNWDGVTVNGNIFKNSFGTAIRLRDKVSGLNIGPNSFIGVTRSAEGNHRAIAVESPMVFGAIGVQYVENTDVVNTMTFVFLSNHSAAEGVTIQAGHRFVGLVQKTNIALNALASPFLLTPVAIGYFTVGAGGPTAAANAVGITGAVWESTGVTLITLNEAASLANNLIPMVACQGSSGRKANFERVGTNQIRVRTFLAGGGTPVDNAFSLFVWAF